MRECRCGLYSPSVNPRKFGACVCCEGRLRPEWDLTNTTVAEFFDRLQEAMFPAKAPEWFQRFRMHCEAREIAGRSTFGHRYLTRDNAVEATEEAADGANYMLMDVLCSRRLGQDEEINIALTAAYHFAKAHEAASRLHDGQPHIAFSDADQD